MISRVFLSCLIGTIVFITGCPSNSSMGKITGTVTYEGRPINKGTIVLEVDGARPATGDILEGKIVNVTTNAPGDGVAVGMARIAIFALEMADESPIPTSNDPGAKPDMGNYMGGDSTSLIPERYNNPQTSQLMHEIKQGDNSISLQLVP